MVQLAWKNLTCGAGRTMVRSHIVAGGMKKFKLLAKHPKTIPTVKASSFFGFALGDVLFSLDRGIPSC